MLAARCRNLLCMAATDAVQEPWTGAAADQPDSADRAASLLQLPAYQPTGSAGAGAAAGPKPARRAMVHDIIRQAGACRGLAARRLKARKLPGAHALRRLAGQHTGGRKLQLVSRRRLKHQGTGTAAAG